VRSLERAHRRSSGLQRRVFARLNCGSRISRCRRPRTHALLLGEQSLRLGAMKRCSCAPLKLCAMVGDELLLCEHILQRARGESLDVHFFAFVAGNRAPVPRQLRGSQRCQAVACAPTGASIVVRMRPAPLSL
jgi:hypothetical protein